MSMRPDEVTLPEAKLHWQILSATGRACAALRDARDGAVALHGADLASASLHLLYEMSGGLLREMGEQLVALRESPNREVRDFVTLLICRLHSEPPMTQPEPREAEPPKAGG